MTTSDDSISDSSLERSFRFGFVDVVVGGGGGGGGAAAGTGGGKGGVGNAMRNGAGIFILFIKCKTWKKNYGDRIYNLINLSISVNSNQYVVEKLKMSETIPT